MRLVISSILAWLVASFISTYAAADIPREMAKLMNKNIEPCNNYYQYACGQWLESQEKSAEKVEFSMKKIEKKRLEILDKVINKRYPALNNFWDSCMSLRYRLRDRTRGKSTTGSGNKYLLEDLNRIANAYTLRDIFQLAGEFSRTGTNAFIEYSVELGGEDHNYALYLRPAKLMLSDDEYRKKRPPYTGDSYYQYIEELMKVAFKKQDRLSNDVYAGVAGKNVIQLEQKLVEIKTTNKGITKTMSLSAAAQQWPNTIGFFVEGMRLDKLNVYIEHSDYFTELEKHIKTVRMSFLKSYLAFLMIQSRASWLGEDFIRVWDKSLRGTTNVLDRHTFCRDRIVEFMPGTVGYYFTEVGLPSTRTLMAREMVKLIRKAMREHIVQSRWMSKEDTIKATKKLEMMVTMIAVPEKRESFPFELSRNNYYTNIRSILEHKFKLQIENLGKRVVRDDWPHSSAIAKTKYNKLMNSVLFPSAMLQSPLLDGVSVHPARDFGAMGVIMGREIVRGFGKTGSGYGELGNKHTWWSEGTKLQFDNEAMTMVNQYSSFKVHGLDAVETLDDNIADAGGLALAWDAYKTHMATHTSNKVPKVTPSDGEKLFYLAFAQSMCTHIPRGLPTESHSYVPPEWRVNGALMNHDHFNNVYGCTAYHKMKPQEQCKIWSLSWTEAGVQI